MPKKSKNSQLNAYALFARDWAKNNNLGHLSLREQTERAGPAWKILPPAEKIRYETQAKQFRGGQKLNSLGIPVAQIERDRKEKEEMERGIVLDIESTVAGLVPETTLRTHDFFFVHTNAFVRTDKGYMVPAEIAVSEFSLEGGVKRVFHRFLNLRPIPLGYSHVATDLSNRTHKIPVPGTGREFGEDDAKTVVTCIRRFLLGVSLDNDFLDYQKGVSLPPMYAPTSVLEVVRECVSAIVAECLDSSEPVPFNVYPMENLFYLLNNKCAALAGADPFPVSTIPKLILDTDLNSQAANISCEYHEEVDVREHCSRSKVYRWCFTLADYCCRHLDIELIENRHCRLNSNKKRIVVQGSVTSGSGYKFKNDNLSYFKKEDPSISNSERMSSCELASADGDALRVKNPTPSTGPSPFAQPQTSSLPISSEEPHFDRETGYWKVVSKGRSRRQQENEEEEEEEERPIRRPHSVSAAMYPLRAEIAEAENYRRGFGIGRGNPHRSSSQRANDSNAPRRPGSEAIDRPSPGTSESRGVATSSLKNKVDEERDNYRRGFGIGRGCIRRPNRDLNENTPRRPGSEEVVDTSSPGTRGQETLSSIFSAKMSLGEEEC